MTVNTPMTAETTATTAADRGGDVDLRAGEEPGFEYGGVELVHGRSARLSCRARRSAARLVAGGRARDDQDAAVHVQHVDVVAVQPAEDLGA